MSLRSRNRAICSMSAWVRPMAKAGMTITPPRAATRRMMGASSASWSIGTCSRLPYVDSQTSTSQAGRGVGGVCGGGGPGCVVCLRAVEVDRQGRDVLALAQPGDMQHGRLGATEGKGRNDDYAPTGSDAADDGGQLRLLVDRNVFPIAICGFADQYVTGGQGRWRVHQRLLLPAQVTTEVQALALDVQADVGSAQDVAGRMEADRDA